MNKITGTGLRWVAAMLSMGTLVSASPITRMDIFDAADNHLLFVTFDYNDKGVCTQRNVFASDSTFMYSTTFTSSNGVTKENSADYLGNPLYVTNVNAPSGGNTSFSTVDQFGLSQYGAPLAWSEAASNSYVINQGGTKLCSEKYEYNADGDLTGITVLDKSGTKTWYALVTHQNVPVRRQLSHPALHSFNIMVNRNAIKLQCTLASAQYVTAELINPQGRRIQYLVHGNISKGKHNFSVPAGSVLAGGAYIVRVSINGTAALTRRVIIQK